MSGRFSIEGVFKARDMLSGVIGKMETRLGRLARAAGPITTRFDKLSSKISSGLGTAAIGGATAGFAALSAGVYSTVRTGSQFEAAMSSVAAVSGATGGELEALRKRALELGSTTKFASAEVAGGMENMVKSGFNVQDTIKGIGGLLSAAAADGGDFVTISEQVMGAMKGLGLGADRMSLFADQLAKAGDATAASIPEITEGLSKFGPVARQLGISTESAIAQISLLRDAGLDASSAGTGLAAIYSKLAAPVGETRKALAQLGVTVADTNGNMKGPEQLFSEILRATDGIKGNVGKMAAMTHLVGLESQKAMLNLSAAAGSGKLDALTKSLQGAAGYADEIAKKRLNNFEGDIKLLTAAVDGLQISLFETQSGPLRGVVQGMTSWINANKGLIQTGLSDFLVQAIPVVKSFGAGVRDGVSDLAAFTGGVQGALGPLESLFGVNSNDRVARAHALGEGLVKLGGSLVALTVLTKAASAATFVYGVITNGVKGVMWLFEATVNGVRGAMVLYELSTKAGVGATLAMSFASKAATVDLLAQRTAAFAAAGGMKALALTAGAAAAAVGALMLAKAANDQLKSENEGIGIGDILLGSLAGKGWSETVNDHQNKLARQRAAVRDQNASLSGVASKRFDLPDGLSFDGGGDLTKLLASLEKAQPVLPEPGDARAPATANRPQSLMVAPRGGGGTASAEQQADLRELIAVLKANAKTGSEIVIKDQTGTAEVKKQGKGTRIKVENSGGM